MLAKQSSKIKQNFEDYSSGRVLYGSPGATNFPVGLASEIFQKCASILKEQGNKSPYVIYDPFCGVGYSLTVLGLLHGENIEKIFASDSNKTMLEFASKNLYLLNKKGIATRILELKKFIQEYKKNSHKEALESAFRLKQKVESLKIKTLIFKFNIIIEDSLPKNVSDIDIVIADVPYGKLTEWENLRENENPIQISLNKIKGRLNKASIVAIVLNKKQEIKYESYIKIKSFKSGKRKVVLLRPNF